MKITPAAIDNIRLHRPSGVKPPLARLNAQSSVVPVNRMVPALDGRQVRKYVFSQRFPRVVYPHPYTISLDWPELRGGFKDLKAEASELKIPGRSKAPNSERLRRIIRAWRTSSHNSTSIPSLPKAFLNSTAAAAPATQRLSH